MFRSSQAVEAAHDIAGFLDGLPGMGTSGAIAQAFVAFTQNLWNEESSGCIVGSGDESTKRVSHW